MKRVPRNTTLPRTLPLGTIEQRLAAQTEIDPLSGCHVWQGRRNRNGYAVISLHGRQQLVHRLAWTLRYGRIRDGMELCHRCDEPRCINPDHHFIGTHQANMADRQAKHRTRIERARVDFAGENLRIDELPRGELSRMRMYIRGVEITGKVRIRPFVPDALPPPKRRSARGLT
jgi:HNH endonuclease